MVQLARWVRTVFGRSESATDSRIDRIWRHLQLATCNLQLAQQRCGLLLFLALSVLLPFPACAAAQTATFDGSAPEFKWPLVELKPDLPADWSGYHFLTLELRASSAQRFELRLFTTNGLCSLLFHPFPNAWIRAAVPLAYFERPSSQGHDLASLRHRSLAGYWVNLKGPKGPLNAVQAIGVAMTDPVGAPTLEIRSIRLDRQSPGDAVLEPKPLVDEFGQWNLQEWPGKAKSLAELQAAWAEEARALAPGEFHCCAYGGYTNSRVRATGFFRVEQIDGRWWFIDPDGHRFFSTGADAIGPWMGTRTAGREGLFAAQPPARLQAPAYRAKEAGTISFFTWNLSRRFGSDWAPAWLDMTLRRMDQWGLNTLANWSDPRLWAAKRKPYIIMLRGWGIESGYLGLPDVFAAEFEQKVDAAAAEQCAPHKEDPWLLGYFVANEPPWPGCESQLCDAILAGPTNAIQREAKAFLAGGDTPARREQFVNRAIERFLAIVNAAIRKQDPNHLNLGLRFGSRPTEAMLRASRAFDVFSMNEYEYQVDRNELERAYRLTGKPILIGEFHFGTPGRGLAPGLVQVKNQAERGVAYRYYVETAAANPVVIGAHWFEWVDEPNTGRHDGENYNIGLVDVTDRPYPELIVAMKTTHQRLCAIHAGTEPPVTRKPLVR